jgi:hypothetical protein
MTYLRNGPGGGTYLEQKHELEEEAYIEGYSLEELIKKIEYKHRCHWIPEIGFANEFSNIKYDKDTKELIRKIKRDMRQFGNDPRTKEGLESLGKQFWAIIYERRGPSEYEKKLKMTFKELREYEELQKEKKKEITKSKQTVNTNKDRNFSKLEAELIELKALYEKGLIDKEVYKNRQKELLSGK